MAATGEELGLGVSGISVLSNGGLWTVRYGDWFGDTARGVRPRGLLRGGEGNGEVRSSIPGEGDLGSMTMAFFATAVVVLVVAGLSREVAGVLSTVVPSSTEAAVVRGESMVS